jgi:hypothetical protein
LNREGNLKKEVGKKDKSISELKIVVMDYKKAMIEEKR